MSNTELIARLRSFETDHKPEGWPAIQMRDVSALLDAIEALESEIQRQYACIRSHAEITHKAEDERDALVAQLAAAQPVQVNAMLVEALEEARNGLAWYQAMYPGATDGSDDEAMERIDAALTAAKDGASDV